MDTEPPINAEQRSAFASWVASHRKRVAGNCRACGLEFVGTKRRRYCSPACRLVTFRKDRGGAVA